MIRTTLPNKVLPLGPLPGLFYMVRNRLVQGHCVNPIAPTCECGFGWLSDRWDQVDHSSEPRDLGAAPLIFHTPPTSRHTHRGAHGTVEVMSLLDQTRLLHLGMGLPRKYHSHRLSTEGPWR